MSCRGPRRSEHPKARKEGPIFRICAVCHPFLERESPPHPSPGASALSSMPKVPTFGQELDKAICIHSQRTQGETQRMEVEHRSEPRENRELEDMGH